MFFMVNVERSEHVISWISYNTLSGPLTPNVVQLFRLFSVFRNVNGVFSEYFLCYKM